ncbi:MAG: Copper chaperone PCu(A)C [Actinomycetota bacterium]
MTGAKTSAASETKLFKGDKSLPEGSEIHVGQTLSLNEAGKHFVLLKLTKPIAFGDKIDFTFEFDGADPQQDVGGEQRTDEQGGPDVAVDSKRFRTRPLAAPSTTRHRSA